MLQVKNKTNLAYATAYGLAFATLGLAYGLAHISSSPVGWIISYTCNWYYY